MCCRGPSSCLTEFDMMHHRCKACSKPSARMKDMQEFDKKLKMSIKVCFSMLTAIEVQPSDQICRKCLRTLVKCSEFIEMCETNETGRRGVQTETETEIEEEIECEVKEEARTVRFEEPPEEAYEPDFEQTSEDEGIHEEEPDTGGRQVLMYYCTVCRRKFQSREELIAHVKGISLYSWVLSD